MIDLRYVKKLIDMIDESSVDSIEITSDKGMKIRISKSPQHRGTVQVAAPLGSPVGDELLQDWRILERRRCVVQDDGGLALVGRDAQQDATLAAHELMLAKPGDVKYKHGIRRKIQL